MNAKQIRKLYYSISEVADMTGLKQYVLRYWESEFLELKPSKNRAGNRIYKEKDIELIDKIKDLLYNKKYTIDGARNYLSQISESEKSTGSNSVSSSNKLELFDSIQKELEGILNDLGDKKQD